MGSVVVDPSSCNSTRCVTLWVGTGEAGIRRETFAGTGLYKLQFITTGTEFLSSGYFATQEPGSDGITGGAISSIALFKPQGATGNRVYFTVSGAVTSSGYDATVFHPAPAQGYGVFMFDDNNPMTPLAREDVPPGESSTAQLPGSVTLTADSQGNAILLASFFNRGIYKKILPAGTWCPLNPGAPAVSGCSTTAAGLPNASTKRFDHVALAASGSTVYAAFSDCSNVWSANGAGVGSFACTASLFVSVDGGTTWAPGSQATGCSGDGCLSTYSAYDHALAVSPLNPSEFYFGGFAVNVSFDHGSTFPAVLNNVHPDVHGVFVSPTTWNAQLQPGTGSLHLVYVAADGGLNINFIDPSNPTVNNTVALAEPPVFSVDRLGVLPCAAGQQCTTAVMAGTNDNGTILYSGGRIWTTLTSADIGDVAFLNANQGVAAWYSIQPSTISTTGFGGLPSIPFSSSATDFDSVEYGKNASNGSSGGPDGHGKVMLPPFVRDSVSGNFYFGTDRVYQVSGSALASGTGALNPISGRLSDDLGPCTRPGTNAQGSCSAFEYCVAGRCRNYYTDIEKIDAISAMGSQSDQVYVGMYSGAFLKKSGAAFVPVTNIPSKRACSAKDIGVIASLLGSALGPTPFDPGALANGSRCAPVTSIDVKPGNPNQAYVTIGGYKNPGQHVFLYTNGGATDTWTPLFDGDLAASADHDIPAMSVRADPAVPGHVFLGTDVGLFERTQDDPSGPWKAVSSVPPVPVDDVVFDTALGRAYAGTHGRGVYMTVSRPVVEVFAGWMDPSMCPPNQPCIWDILVYGQGFQPPGLGQDPACTINILDENGNTCAGGTVDAFSGQPIKVLGSGMIGQTVFNESDGKAVIAACFNGNCIGPSGTVPISACEPDATHPNRVISAVQVLCPNNNQAVVSVGKFCPQLQSPPATSWDPTLTADPPPSASPPITSVTLVAALDGMPSEVLCSVNVPIFASDHHDDIVDRARAAFTASTACKAAGVLVQPKATGGLAEVEDLAFADQLQLSAPSAIGRALYIATITDPSSPGAPGFCQHYQNFPGYATSQLDILDTTFTTTPTGARGGSVTFTETSPLGRCSITVPTTPGEMASDIAQSISNAYHAAYAIDSNAACPYSSNPGDLVTSSPFVPLAPGTLNTIASTALDVCVNDTGVGFTLGPNNVPLLSTTLSQACLFATGSLLIEEGTQVTEPAGGFALVANAGSAQTTLGPEVSVGAVMSIAPVTIGDEVTIPGIVKSSGTITLGNRDVIGGPVVSSTGVVLPDLSQYKVTFPASFAPGLLLGSGAHGSLAPGAYVSATVQKRAVLSLTTGTYFFTHVDFEPHASIVLDDSNGPVVINVRDSADLRGAFSSTQGGDPKLRVVYAGTETLRLRAPFSGTAVAPKGTLVLGRAKGCSEEGREDDDCECDRDHERDREHDSDRDGDREHDHGDRDHARAAHKSNRCHKPFGYRGSFFGQNVEVEDDVVVAHLPPQ